MLEIFISSFLNTISLIGSGSFTLLFLKELKKTNSEKLILLIIFGLLTSATISVLLNFFFPINFLISNIYVASTFLIGLLFIKKFKEINFLILIIFTSILATLVLYKSQNVVDFPVYHSPFLSILGIEKAIFGLTNLHFRFGHISIVQNSMALHNISLFYPNNFQSIIPVFFSAFLIFYFIQIQNIKKYKSNNKLYLFNFFIFSYICIKYYRFNDFGNDLLSNLLVFFLWSKFFEIYENIKFKPKNLNNDVLILILIYTLCLFNKSSSILNFIPILIIFFHTQKFDFFIKNLKFFLIMVIVVASFVSKNIISSGCIIYPASFSCFKEMSWTTSTKDNLSSPKKISIESEAWAKDWPNRTDKNIINVDYIKKFNWLKTWSNNHLQKIVKKLSVYYFYILIILFLILITNKISLNFRFNKKKILMIFFAIIPVIFWFLKFPIYRYSSSNLIIFLNMGILYFVSDKINLNKLKKFFRFNSYFLFLTMILLNLNKIHLNIKNSHWPNIIQPKNLIIQKLYFQDIIITQTINDVCYFSEYICTHFKVPKNLKISRKSNYIFIEHLKNND